MIELNENKAWFIYLSTWYTKKLTHPVLLRLDQLLFYVQHCWSGLAARERLQSAHTSKTNSDSMEMCWFSENNGVTRLSFALLTRTRWLWRLETCWHKHLIGLFPPSNLLFAPYFLQGYETTVHFWDTQHLLQALGFVIMIAQVKVALSYNEGKYYARKDACSISEERIKHVETGWEKKCKCQVNPFSAP